MDSVKTAACRGKSFLQEEKITMIDPKKAANERNTLKEWRFMGITYKWVIYVPGISSSSIDTFIQFQAFRSYNILLSFIIEKIKEYLFCNS